MCLKVVDWSLGDTTSINLWAVLWVCSWVWGYVVWLLYQQVVNCPSPSPWCERRFWHQSSALNRLRDRTRRDQKDSTGTAHKTTIKTAGEREREREWMSVMKTFVTSDLNLLNFLHLFHSTLFVSQCFLNYPTKFGRWEITRLRICLYNTCYSPIYLPRFGKDDLITPWGS